jgi:hypothetical protein
MGRRGKVQSSGFRVQGSALVLTILDIELDVGMFTYQEQQAEAAATCAGRPTKEGGDAGTGAPTCFLPPSVRLPFCPTILLLNYPNGMYGPFFHFRQSTGAGAHNSLR